MILQALCDYYERKDSLPKLGFEERGISFIVVVDSDGNYLNIEDSREKDGSRLVPKSFILPALPSTRKASLEGVKSGATAGIAWDHFGYTFGQPKIDKKLKIEQRKDADLALAQFEGFKSKLKEVHEAIPRDVGISALIKFYEMEGNIQKIKRSDLWEDIIKKDGSYIAFRLAGSGHLICQSEDMIAYVESSHKLTVDGMCLVSGEKTEISRTHRALNVNGGTNPKLVSFNKEAFESYGKSQSYNSPVGVAASFKYASALNYMLRNGSTTKFNVADAQYVCWSDRSNRLENDVSLFLSVGDDDPDATATAVKALFNSIHNGAYKNSDGNDRFFILGLSPNSARIVVRYWNTGTIAEFSENFARWFSDLELIGLDHYGRPTLRKLLRATALQFKDDNVAPNLPGEVIRAILAGGRLPETLIQAVLRRIRAEKGNVSYVRACAIKAYLNRKYRFSTIIQGELTVSLNKHEIRIGYCLGRLFAALEKLQQDAQPGIKATIRDRYYNSASTTPKSVFGTLMRLSTHHLKKLENPGWRVNAENRISEVMALIGDFPAHLNLENQSLFALGYYHQKQDFFTKKSDRGVEV